MPRHAESDNTDSNGPSQENDRPIAGIDDNNILGDQYFEVKSEHCLMPLLPQVNSYNRNMVLSMGHSGVKFIIEKISRKLEQDFKVSANVREKIMDRNLITEKQISVDKELIKDAQKLGRRGIVQNMVLFDMDKREEKELNKKSLLEYRSTDDGKTSVSTAESGKISGSKRQPINEIDQLLADVSDQPLPPQIDVKTYKQKGKTIEQVTTKVSFDDIKHLVGGKNQ